MGCLFVFVSELVKAALSLGESGIVSFLFAETTTDFQRKKKPDL